MDTVTEKQFNLTDYLAPEFRAIEEFVDQMSIKSAIVSGLDKIDTYRKMRTLNEKYREMLAGKVGQLFRAFAEKNASLAERNRQLEADNSRLEAEKSSLALPQAIQLGAILSEQQRLRQELDDYMMKVTELEAELEKRQMAELIR